MIPARILKGVGFRSGRPRPATLPRLRRWRGQLLQSRRDLVGLDPECLRTAAPTPVLRPDPGGCPLLEMARPAKPVRGGRELQRTIRPRVRTIAAPSLKRLRPGETHI
jgi:hypothetical protein